MKVHVKNNVVSAVLEPSGGGVQERMFLSGDDIGTQLSDEKEPARQMEGNGKILQEEEILWTQLPGHRMSFCPWRMRRGFLERPVG